MKGLCLLCYAVAAGFIFLVDLGKGVGLGPWGSADRLTGVGLGSSTAL